MIVDFKENVQKMNIKENWSVLRYTGETDPDFDDFTHGRYYYWACSADTLVFEGAISDEGLPLYGDYSPDSSVWASISQSWEIAEDPTGIAYNLLKRR
jgi:hypothetical protein